MKKILITVILFTIALFSVNAQGFYFDIGLGVGGGWTRLNGIDVARAFEDEDIRLTKIGVDLGLKAGYGPIGNTPLYVVGAMGAIGHRLADDQDYIQFNSYLIGAGLIFYPIYFIQIAGDIGFSFVANQSSLGGEMYRSTGGFAGDISVAFDLGGTNHGALLGLRYFGAVNRLETSDAQQNQSGLSVFVRYTYRHRINSRNSND